ncbi:ABC transporter permease [Protofrankia symbiont of Coriaria ruscifolia]|uniref:ABC transporter n=1 Tax=Candidatus Protofrankia californiensis TaxID=1839754 RepID=A0A1C3NYN9_9ACTN|nr:ABC transporter permease [Protofrankia symbiont of Coriaria ruscifolia]SBW22664.1 ABC transporter [Candidatus Protofrankia californiensis]
MYSSLPRFLLRRVLTGVVVLWGAVTVTFFAVSAAGGDQVDAILGPQAANLPGLRAQVAAEYGLDHPLPMQYLDRLASLATGDFGRSYQRNEPVTRLLASQILPTLELALSAAVIGLLLALVATVITSGRGRIVRTGTSVFEVLAVAIPPFWLGILLLSIFSFNLRWFPAFGSHGVSGLVLPTLALAIPISGVLAQVMRQELELVEGRPFVLSARARGQSRLGLLLRHTLRHALLPATTMSAWVLGTLVGGAVLVEKVFSRPGLGTVLVNAVQHRDTPVVSAVVIMAALIFVVANTLADTLYPVIDARLREASRA